MWCDVRYCLENYGGGNIWIINFSVKEECSMKKKMRWCIAFFLSVLIIGGQNRIVGAAATDKKYESFELPAFHVYAKSLADSATVGSKIATDINELPASVSLINSDEMERLGVYNLTDALEYNAGITVAPRGYDSLYNFSKLRGFDISHNNLVVDGMKTFGAVDNMTSLELYGAEQVEILRGPASVLFGSGSVSGTINIKTKRPRKYDFAESQLQIGSHGEKMTAVDVNGTNADGSLYGRVVSVWRDQKLFYDDTKHSRIYIAPSLTKKLGANGTFTLLPFYSKDRINGYAYSPRTRIKGDPLYGILPDKFFVGVKGWDKYNLDQYGIGYELEYKVGDGVTFHQRGTYRRSDVLSNQTTGIFNPVVGALTRFGAMLDSKGSSWGLDQFIHWRRENKNKTADTVLGFDWRYEKIFTKQKMRNLAMWSLDELQQQVAGTGTADDPATDQPGSILPMDDLRYWSREKGLYLNHSDYIGDVKYTAGIRRGLYSQYSERDEGKFSQNALTGQIGFVYGADKPWHPYLHWHNSFDPVLHRDKDNKLLEPTTGSEWELGVRYAPKGSPVRLTAALFDLRKQNIHVGVPGTQYFTSIGEIASQGVEFEWRAAVNDRLRLLGSYTYLDAKTTKHTNQSKVGLRPGGVAKNTFNLRADAVLSKYNNGELTFGLGARHIGRRLDDSNKITMGGVTLFDASLSLSRGKDAWTFHVRNLLNKKYMSNIEPMWGVPLGFAGQERTWIFSYIHKW